MTGLRVDWATHDAIKYACKNWHYSRSVPAGKLVKIGVWESSEFVGAIVFSRGATPNIGRPFGLTQYEICELTRVAYKPHSSFVSQGLALALRFLHRFCPDIKLVVSFADVDQGHHGGIYQATNWIYLGVVNEGTTGAFMVRGKKIHPRTIGAMGGVQSLEWIRANMDPRAQRFITAGKHKYVYAFDQTMKTKLNGERKPYPKPVASIGG